MGKYIKCKIALIFNEIIDCMKNHFIFGIIFIDIVLVFVALINIVYTDSGIVGLKSKPEYIPPRGYRRLNNTKEAYMLDLIDIRKKQTSLWRVYASSPRNMLYCFYNGEEWIVPNDKTFIAMKALAVYNAFGMNVSGVTFSLPPLSGMEETWRRNIEDFRQGKWFR